MSTTCEQENADTLVAADGGRGAAAAELGAHIAPVYKPLWHRPFVDGNGAWLIDDEGEKFLDMTSGIAVLALGHRSKVVARAMAEASDSLLHTSNLFLTKPALKLAEALTRRSFADRVFFANSGTEAIEGAIKFARAVTPTSAQRVVYFDSSFHGRSYGALAATDRLNQVDCFGKMLPDFVRAPWGDVGALDAIDGETAAAIIEPVQGEGGVRPAKVEWMRRLRDRCDEVGAKLIFDEIQCGLGRTGRLWAHEHFGITPDLMTVAKPLAGGLPIGAILMTEEIAEGLTPGCHGSTFGGGPAITHVALRVLETIDDDELLGEVSRKGELLMRLLGDIDSPAIESVRGLGLMIGAVVSVPPADILKAASNARLLITSAGKNVIRFLPPLTTTDDELKEAARRFAKALEGIGS